MKPIAVINEKGGTAKTTTSVNLSAALAERGLRVLLVDLDGQAASSRWLGVEEDSRLADAIIAGGGLEPIATPVKNLWLAPASGKLDSISHELRPTQGGQLRRVLAQLDARFDFCLMDCPPSLGNRLIGNALLAAQGAIVPVETSILALDGLRILLTVLEDVRKGFDHDIELLGVLACRYDARTRLSRLVTAELERALPGRTFHTRIREAVRIRECPAVSKTIFEYAPDCTAAADYRSLAGEILEGRPAAAPTPGVQGDLASEGDLSNDERRAVGEFRRHAAKWFATEPEGSPAPQDTAGPGESPLPARTTVVLTAEASTSVPVTLVEAPAPRPTAPQVDSVPSGNEVLAAASAAMPPGEAPQVVVADPQIARQAPKCVSGAWVATPAPGQEPARRRWLAPAATTLVVLTVLGVWLALRALHPNPTPAQAAGGLVIAPTAPRLPQTPARSATPPVVASPAPVAAPGGLPKASGSPVAPPIKAPTVETPQAQAVAAQPTRTLAPAPPPPPAATEATKAPKPHAGPEYVTPPADMAVSAIMNGGGDNLAVVNGKILQVGQTLRGWQVVTIGENSVDLERDGKRVALRLGVPGSSK